MTREEAIKTIMSANVWTDEEREALGILIPELAESEDERIRKALIDGVRQIRCKNGITQEQMIAYLEKQKENPKSADSIPSDCTTDAKCDDRWHKVADFLPDSGRDVLAKDALGNYLLASFDGDQWFVSVYDGEDKPIVYTPAIKEWCDIPSEKQKEQKPRDYRKLYEEVVNSEWFKENYAGKSLGEEQKPAWTEADEVYLEDALWCVDKAEKSCKDGDDKGACWSAKRWLKSLRPSWKPSEEQMDALKSKLPIIKGTGNNVDSILESLYEQLNKL